MKTIALVAALAAALPASAAQAFRPTVAVTGLGRVAVAPNIARVTITVSKLGAPATPVPTLVAENQERVVPTLAYVKEVVGSNGQVTATSQINKVQEYDHEKRQQVFKGHQVVTQISIELKGKGAIEQKLGRLFDTSQVRADDISAPVLGLSDASHQAAKRRAYLRAVKNARSEAQAQLEPGERLGRAIDRGTGAGVASRGREKGMARLAMAESAMMDDGGGAAPTVETGNISVSAVTNVIFEVLGVPSRLVRALRK